MNTDKTLLEAQSQPSCLADVMFSLSDVVGHTVRYKNGNVLKVCGGSELGLLHINEDTQTTFGFGRLENVVEIID